MFRLQPMWRTAVALGCLLLAGCATPVTGGLAGITDVLGLAKTSAGGQGVDNADDANGVDDADEPGDIDAGGDDNG